MADTFSIGLTVGGVGFTLSSQDNKGFSLQRIAEDLLIDFSNFTGSLRIHASAAAEPTSDSAGKEVLQSPTEDTRSSIDVSQPVKDENAQENGDDDDVCVRLQQSLESSEHPYHSPSTEDHEASELQLACARPNVSVMQLYTILRAEPKAASFTDDRGRYPLHILSENAVLLANSFLGSREGRNFTISLLEACPEALLAKDESGAIPFFRLLQTWVLDAYRKSTVGVYSFTNEGGGIMEQVTTVITPFEQELVPQQQYKFPTVKLIPAVQATFEILSCFLERLNLSNNPNVTCRETNLLVRGALAQQIAAIPELLQTIYLIGDKLKRNQVLESAIVKRILFCRESVGDWVCNMLQSQSDIPSDRVVDYLEQVSALTVADYIGNEQSPESEDVTAFKRDKKEVYLALDASGEMVPDLTLLNEEAKRRAASTGVVWSILNRTIARPLVIGIVMADFMFNIVLLMSFRYATGTNTLNVEGTLDSTTASMLVLSLCLYFLLRKMSEFTSMVRLSVRAFKSYSLEFFNFVDFFAVVLAAITAFTRSDNSVLLALTMAALWLKFLGFLKAVNSHMAVFILAILEIVMDIRWFLLVLTIVIFMSADVIQIITVEGGHCDEGGEVPEEFCSNLIAPVYLKLYAVIVGDMDLNDFRYSTAIEFIFVLFALLAVIVLLNVLIAVVSDSYQKSVENGRQLFGRARLAFTVTFLAQEHFLKGEGLSMGSGCRSFVVWVLSWIGRLAVMVALVWTAVITEYSLAVMARDSYHESGWWVFMAVFAGLMLLIATVLVLHKVVEAPLCRFATRTNTTFLIGWLNGINRAAVGSAGLVFGTENIDQEVDEGDPRVQMIEKSTSRLMSMTKESLLESMESAERRIIVHASNIAERIRSQIEALSNKKQQELSTEEEDNKDEHPHRRMSSGLF